MTTTTQTFTIKQALAITPDAIAALSLDAMQALADALATSTDKRASRKLDLVAGILEGKRKEAKKEGNKEAEQEFKAVENSVKRVGKKKPVPAKPKKEVTEETEQGELPLDEEPEAEAPKKLVGKKPAPAKKPVPAKKDKPEAEEKSASAKDELAEMKKKMAQLEKENARLSAEIFPDAIEREKGNPLVAVDLPNVQDVQKLLVERPLQLFVYAHEGIDDKPTAFTVLFMNEEILVLLDRSREKNSTLTLEVKKMKAKSIQIDKRDCPFRFYLPEAK